MRDLRACFSLMIAFAAPPRVGHQTSLTDMDKPRPFDYHVMTFGPFNAGGFRPGVTPMKMPRRRRLSHDRPAVGFTIVELMVAVAVIAILIALLIPSLQQAKRLARITVCSANMRQHAQLTGTYAADCKGAIVSPSSPHGIRKGLLSYTSVATISPTANTCPDSTTARTYPSGFGWFYALGYLPPTAQHSVTFGTNGKGGKFPLLICPDAPIFRNTNRNWAQFDDDQYGTFSVISNILPKGNIDVLCNPMGGSGSGWDCVEVGQSSYFNLAWNRYVPNNAQTAASVASTPRIEKWRPDAIVEIDGEKPDFTIKYYMEMHGDGLNLQYIDGHVRFGGKDINGLKPHVFYGMTVAGVSEGAAYGWGNFGWDATGAHAGWAMSNYATWRLFRYYETGER
jgi:prepilin-type processing-associated H-X9-DG protein